MSTLAEAYQLFHDGSIALADIKHRGVQVDLDYLAMLTKKIDHNIQEATARLRQTPEVKKWQQLFGVKTNLASRTQLGDLLFKVYKHKPLEFNKKSQRGKADERFLSEVNTEFSNLYLEMEKQKKLRSTYVEGILKEVKNGFVHPSYALNTVSSYRSSCFAPNFQNIPKRNPIIAKLARGIYIPREGYQIVEIDYSRLEVVIAATYHRDPVMIRYINDKNACMHRDTARDVFMLDNNDQVSDDARYAAKNMMVFPQFYGSIYTNCAMNLWKAIKSLNLRIKGTETSLYEHLRSHGIKDRGLCDFDRQPEPVRGTFEHHIKGMQNSFWEDRFTVYAEWKEQFWLNYLRTGQFQFKTGFICSADLRKNQVINFGTQGVAFHCLLKSLIMIREYLIKKKMRSRIIGEIHDALVAEVHPEELEEFIRISWWFMTKKIPQIWPWVTVPLDVEVEVCPVNESWANKKKIKLEDFIHSKGPQHATPLTRQKQTSAA